ncbi:E3 ubiquitin-protein ligase PHF7-like [Athene noctua]|uniref:E3 ubiquitin-protein ligase PHF7-like n=1 Tax=Athene noctua TaxID=126797 RepID=UPI003EBA6806
MAEFPPVNASARAALTQGVSVTERGLTGTAGEDLRGPCPPLPGADLCQRFFRTGCFCREHRPEQQVEAAPEENTDCLICLEPVGDRKSFHTLVCPICKHAWFHRVCIQGQARYTA